MLCDGVCDIFNMPRIYCYCFSKESTVEGRVKDVIKRAEMANVIERFQIPVCCVTHGAQKMPIPSSLS